MHDSNKNKNKKIFALKLIDQYNDYLFTVQRARNVIAKGKSGKYKQLIDL
jgi:hypothetical protein